MYPCPNFEPVRCSMSSSNHCFLACIQVSQAAGDVVWYSHLFKNFSQIAVICTVKGFRVVNEAEVGIFKESPCFLYDPILAVLSLVPLPFLHPSCTAGSPWFMNC